MMSAMVAMAMGSPVVSSRCVLVAQPSTLAAIVRRPSQHPLLATGQQATPAGYRGRVAPPPPPARKRVRLDYDERRGQILTAARRLFCQRPYSEVSMVDLAEAAGVARGLLHHYFGSKRDLYLAVMRELIQVPTIPLPEHVATLDTAQVWDASVEGWMRLIESNRELWLTAIGAGGTGRDPELEEILDEGREHTARRALEALGIDPADAPGELLALVRGYGGLAQEITREWLERGRLSRAQAKALLRAALPALLEQGLPAVRAAGAPGER
jgi:AcrR family transcriptional regulator